MGFAEFFNGMICAGTSGWGCSVIWLSMIGLFLGIAVFRKIVANDLLGMDFSLIGSVALGEACIYFINLIFGSVKWGLIIGILGMLIGGFLGGKILPDKESDSESSTGGYDEA